MTDRRLPVVASDRRFGRRAGDAALKGRLYAAAFVAQVAGLSMPRGAAGGGYAVAEPCAPKGLVRDERV
jgi:uncharacterized membrane protein YbhN (UPF0104 family)